MDQLQAFTQDLDQEQPQEPQLPVQSANGILQFPDGSGLILDPEKREQPKLDPNNHWQNLAEVLPSQVVDQIGYELKEAVDNDIDSQQEYFEAVANIIDLLGIRPASNNDEQDLPYEGAPTVSSMALFDNAINFLATLSANLLPSSNMVDCVIQGNPTPELQNISDRKKAWFNYYLTQVAKEFRKEAKRTFFWAALTGSIYKKIYIDPILKRPTSIFIRPEHFIVNREHASHFSASRKTHIQNMSTHDYKIRQLQGMYREEIDAIPSSDSNDLSNEIQEALDEVSGYDKTASQDEEFYQIYEIYCDYYIPEDPLAPEFEMALPYIISVDAKSGNVLAIYRNWNPDDPAKQKREYFVNYSLFPALEGEGWGLIQYAGKLAQAATVMTRQLINTATYASFPGGVYAQGMRMENNNIQPAPGEFVPLQTGGIPINQVIMPLPYKDPSPALKELRDDIEDNIRKPSEIVNEKILELAPRAPMGTVLNILEVMQKVPNMLVQGFHESFGFELELFNERFFEWIPDGAHYPFLVAGGDAVIAKNDFRKEIMVIPASDPSLHNSAFRALRSEMLLAKANEAPQLHNLRYAYQHYYETSGLDAEEINQLLLPPPQDIPPFSGDPITENQFLLVGKAVTATLPQDHEAHMIVHGMILNDPQSQPQQLAAANAHIQEHRAQQLLVMMQAQIGFQMPEDPSQIPPEMQNEIAVQAAQVVQQMQQNNQPAPPPPLDPAQVMLEDVKVKAELGHAKHEVERLRIALDEQKLQEDTRIKELQIQQKQNSDALKADLENKKIELDHLRDAHNQLLKTYQSKENTNEPQK